MSGPPTIELLWWRGCPSWERALEELRTEVAGAGLDPDSIAVTEIETDEQAGAERFVGSPTIRIGGRDVQPPAGAPTGLTCRVYKLRDGRISALPDAADLRDAVAAALGGEERE